ncbi:MAG TPA: hypothetical protein PK068_10730 [Nitrosomonas sp.]|nr:hypothetical protein [Nitrosomonas sp.]
MTKVNSQVKRDQLVPDQLAGFAVDVINSSRFASELSSLAAQDAAFTRALLEIENVRSFLGTPENILGSQSTKHGEIAENVEVGVRNAQSLVEGGETTAGFDDVGRTDPTDYLVDGQHVQSKFINGTNQTLTHVEEHMEKYAQFGRDGNSYYHIPKDQHEQIQRVLDGSETELSEKTQRAIREHVARIEEETGKPFNEVVKPGVSDYREVQQGTVHKTLDKHEQDIEERNEQRKDDIVKEHQPSLVEAAKATGIAAAVGGCLSLGMAIWLKSRQGKNLFKGEFTKEDWQEVGIKGLKGAAGGAISGAAIYGLTNFADMSAPLACAFVSAGKGIYALHQSYLNNEINEEQFLEMSLIACSEAAIVGMATALGQTLIPIPLLGATIGSMAGRLVAEFVTGKTAEKANRMLKEFEDYVGKLDQTLQKVYAHIQQEIDRLGRLTEAAFDLSQNCALVEASIALAEAYGVDENRIIRTNQDLERFLFG